MPYTLVDPPGEWFTPMQPGERRVRGAVLGSLLQLPDTGLVSPAVTLARQDGQTLGPSDLQIIGSPSIDTTGQIVSVTLGNAALSNVGYLITFSANGNITGNPVFRTVSMYILAVVG